MEWAEKENIDESRLYVEGIRDLCQILETPGIIEIPQSMFLIMVVLCEKILSLLPITDEDNKGKKEV